MAGLIAAWARLRRWAWTLFRFALMQTLAQVASVMTGILIVRILAKQDYAFYTIANTWLGALLIMSNGGITDAATAIGGRVWDDRFRLGQVVRAAMRIRRSLGLMMVAPIIGILVGTLARAGASTATIVGLTLLVTLAGLCQISNGVLLVVPRLKGKIRQLQWIDLGAAALRLALTAGAALAYLDALAALFVSLVINVAQYLTLSRWTGSLIDRQAPVDHSVLWEIRRNVARQWPSQVYYVFQSQIGVVLLSLFGTTGGVADLGALNRIGIVFLIVGALMQSIVLPRYARCQDIRELRSFYVEIVVGFSILALIPVGMALLAPRPILWVLGPRYEHLSLELFLVTAQVALAAVAGIAWNLNTIRAWVEPWWLAIPANLTTQLVSMWLIGVSTVWQVQIIAILTTVVALLIQVGFTLVHTRGFTRIGDRRRAFAGDGATDGTPYG